MSAVRDPGSDAARAVAILLVVALHAALPYATHPPPDVLWVVTREPASGLYDLIFWAGNTTAMPLFFFLAGVFSEPAIARRGLAGFARGRARRLGLPFFGGGLVVLPITYFVWASGWLLEGRATVREILRVKLGPDIQPNVYGPAHLWFLEDLILLTIALVLARLVSSPSRVARSPLRMPLLAAIPTFVVLAADPGAATRFANSFVPDGPKLLYYAWFFAVGCATGASGESTRTLAHDAGLRLAGAAAAFLVAVWLLPDALAGTLGPAGRMAFAGAVSFAAWLSLLGVLGACHRGSGSPLGPGSPLGRLAAASYWIYVVHFPVVGLAQLALSELPVSAHLKFPIVLAAALSVSFASWERLGTRRPFRAAGVRGRRTGAAPLPTDPRPEASR